MIRSLLAVFLVFLWTASAGTGPIPGKENISSGIEPGGQELTAGTQRIECPKKTDRAALSLKAPSRADYIKLVETLLTEYSKTTSRYRGKIDAVLEHATSDGDGADLGAIFQGLGAGPAAVYSTAWSAKRNPDDPLIANNLGVELKDMGDYRRAMAVLLYADSVQPNAPLILVNRAWVLYELGDLDEAKPLFDEVARRAPVLTSAQIGLGLIAHCHGDKATAEKHFRKALEARMTPAMAAAWRRAQGEEKGGSAPSSEAPKEEGKLQLPEMPSNPSVKEMATAGPALQNLSEGLDSKLKQLMQRRDELSRVYAKQLNRTSQGGPEEITVYRSLDTTQFVYSDIASLVFAEQGPLGEALSRWGKYGEESAQRALARVPELERQMKRLQEQEKEKEALRTRHDQELAPMEREKERLRQLQEQGRDVSAALERLQAKYEQVMARQNREFDELVRKIEKERYEWCKDDRKFQEGEFQAQAAILGPYSQTLHETLTDFYKFTTPVIENAFSPSLGELLNVEREIIMLTHLRSLAAFYEALASSAENIASLECFPPSEEEPPPESEEANVPQTKPWCPFKKPLKVKVMVISVEVDCEKFKVEGGAGILGSVERNFKTKETTIFLGVGADVGVTGFGGGAKMGGSFTYRGDNITNAAFQSEVSAELGIVSTSVSATVAVEGGPSVALENTIGWGGTGVGKY